MRATPENEIPPAPPGDHYFSLSLKFLEVIGNTEYRLEPLSKSSYYSDRTILDRCIEIKNLFHHLIRQKKMIMRNGANRIFHFIISIQKPYFKDPRKELKYGQCGNI